MRQIRRRPALVTALGVALGLTVLQLAALAQGQEHRHDHEGGGYVVPAGEPSEAAEIRGTPCAGIINGLTRQTPRDEIAAAGLSTRGLPARMTRNNEIATWTCLSDPLKGVVDAMLVEFNDSRGNWVATYAILSPATPDRAEWGDYLSFVAERPDGLFSSGEGFAALSANDSRGSEAADLMRQPRAERTNAWSALIEALAARE